MASFWSSFFSLGLTRHDYQRIIAMAVYATNILLFGWVCSFKHSPLYIGWAISAVILTLTLTSVAVVKYFHTAAMSKTVIGNFVAASLILVIPSVYVWQTELKGDFSITSLLLLSIGLGYLALVFLGMAAYRLWEDDGEVSPMVVLSGSYGLTVIFLFILLVFIFQHALVGAALLGAFFGCLYMGSLVSRFKKNGGYLPRAYKRSAFVLLSFMALAGILYGMLSDSSSAPVISTTITWLAGFLVLVVMGARSAKYMFYDKDVFPVFIYDERKDVVREFNTPILCGYANLVMILFWGLFATMFIDPHYVGTLVTSFVYFLFVTWTYDMRVRTASKLGKALSALGHDDKEELVKTCLEQVGEGQLDVLAGFDSDDDEDDDFGFEYASEAASQTDTARRGDNDTSRSPQLAGEEALSPRSPRDAVSGSRPVTVNGKPTSRMATKIATKATKKVVQKPLMSLEERIDDTLSTIKELKANGEKMSHSELSEKRSHISKDLRRLMSNMIFKKTVLWSVHHDSIPERQVDYNAVTRYDTMRIKGGVQPNSPRSPPRPATAASGGGGLKKTTSYESLRSTASEISDGGDSVFSADTKLNFAEVAFYYNRNRDKSTWKEPTCVANDRRMRQLLSQMMLVDELVHDSHWSELEFMVHLQMLAMVEASHIIKKRSRELKQFLVKQGLMSAHTEKLLLFDDERDGLEDEFREIAMKFVEYRGETIRAEAKEEERGTAAASAADLRAQLLEELRLASEDGFLDEKEALDIIQTRIALAEEGRFVDEDFPHAEDSIGQGAVGYGEGRCEWLSPPFSGAIRNGRFNTGCLFNETPIDQSLDNIQTEDPNSHDGIGKLARASSARDVAKHDPKALQQIGEPRYVIKCDASGAPSEWVSPNDVIQGALGDCYFLSALSVISQEPERLRQLFINDTPNAAGVYGVKFWKNGRWECVVVDDCFPCSLGDELPLYVHSHNSSTILWPLILEKAYAKYHRSYANIIGGHVSDALVDLSGPDAAVEEFQLKAFRNLDILWDKLQGFTKLRYLMGAHSPESQHEQLGASGIVLGHAYSILTLQEVKSQGKVYRLVQVRNPHGVHGAEWNGAWSDNAPEWTDKLKIKLKHTEKADGIFWMSIADLVKEFRSIYVCRMFDSERWHKSEFEGEWSLQADTCGGFPNGRNPAENNPQLHIRPLTDRPTVCFITINQDEVLGAEFQPMALFLVNNNGNRLHRIKGKNSLLGSTKPKAVRQASMEITLEPSSHPYTLIPCVQKVGMEAKFDISVYSNYPVQFELIDRASVGVSDC